MTIDQICTEHIEQEGTAAIVTEFLRTTTTEYEADRKKRQMKVQMFHASLDVRKNVYVTLFCEIRYFKRQRDAYYELCSFECVSSIR